MTCLAGFCFLFLAFFLSFFDKDTWHDSATGRSLVFSNFFLLNIMIRNSLVYSRKKDTWQGCLLVIFRYLLVDSVSPRLSVCEKG